jgi:glucose-6-phosphate 1-epimerase
MALDVTNRDDVPFTFEEALHTYFSVGHIERVALTGLERTDYFDKVAGSARRGQPDEPIRFHGEMDRVYLDTGAACVIHDPGMKRRIRIAKSGSRATVVWNPWIAKARAMPDFGDLEWPGMLCVETANVEGAAVRLEPGHTHRMTASIDVEHMSLAGPDTDTGH